MYGKGGGTVGGRERNGRSGAGGRGVDGIERERRYLVGAAEMLSFGVVCGKTSICAAIFSHCPFSMGVEDEPLVKQ